MDAAQSSSAHAPSSLAHSPEAVSRGVVVGREDRIAGLFTPWGLGATLLVGFAFVGLFFRWFMLQGRLSAQAMEDWGHCLVVPLFAGYLVWREREAIARERPEPYWPGLIAVLTGMAGYFFFVAGKWVHMGQGLALVLAAGGVVLLVLGTRMLRHLFIPVAFLFLMVQVAESWMLQLTAPLRTIAATGGEIGLGIFAPLLGYQIDRGGNVLTITTSGGAEIPLDIAEACSGMRMVMAFVSLACVVAILGCKAWWQRVALVLLAVPVAIVINVVRVVVLGLLSLYDPGLASGDAHMLIGTILLIPGFGLFWLTKWALERIMHEPAPAGATHVVARRLEAPARGESGRSLRTAVLGTGLLLGTGAIGMGAAINYFKAYLQKLEIYPETGDDVRTVPTKTANWTQLGSDTIFPQEIVDTLGTKNYVTRRYQAREARAGARGGAGEKPIVELHLAYYTGLLDAVPHVPERCFTGAGLALTGGPWTVDIPMATDGWVVDEAWLRERAETLYTVRTSNEYSRRPGQRVALPSGVGPGRPIQLRVSQYTDGQGRVAWTGYFFLANGGWVSSAEGVRDLAFKFSDRYAYFMKVQVQSMQVTSPEGLAELAGGLLGDMMGDVMFTVPDWREVRRGAWPREAESGKGAGDGGAGGS